MVVYTDRNGEQTFERNVFNRERQGIFENPLFEEIVRNQDQLQPDQIKRANLLVAYQKNIDNRYDLDVQIVNYVELPTS